MTHRQGIYESIGGIDKVDELVDRFYDLMSLEPQFSALRAMHPQDLSTSREKLKFFLTGWMGVLTYIPLNTAIRCFAPATYPSKLESPSAINGWHACTALLRSAALKGMSLSNWKNPFSILPIGCTINPIRQIS